MDTNLKEQIEAAFDYRGNVTATLQDGSTVVGFLFNRDYGSEQRAMVPFVEFILAGSAEKHKLTIAQVRSIELSGDDPAAGKSYEDWIKKKAAQKAAES